MHFPFFTLPFDHRNGLARDVLNVEYPFSDSDLAKAKELKHMVFEAILQVRDVYKGSGTIGSLFDEETALDVIIEAQKVGLPVTVSMEKSGTKTLQLIHGLKFGERLNELRPTFGKILVHYHPGHEDENVVQRKIIKEVSDFGDTNGVPIMLEILLDKKGAHTPDDMLKVFSEIHGDGIKVGIWKIEGFDKPEDWKAIAPEAKAPMIILGRGQNQSAVETWVQAAAKSGVVDGFAIGRTIFQDALSAYSQGTVSRSEAVQKIADNFTHFIKLWEKSSPPALPQTEEVSDK
jgi:myo-inositol catabolism protein IolC